MIELKDIRKAYTTGSFVQTALDGISATFRDNEFVAILGQSGSGKTTMLNILGGLDHANSGEIVINGVSTKQYKAKDWDTYRNHHVGFVFQSYNLIPHQTILSNVELALTLSGEKGSQKKERALNALDRVGLKEHAHKKPNQLSGGQMQRVAIARALVNDPDIVLADEPTGALDGKTGIQIMDLLREVAHDRLVIMVTHNPELAQDYATRIIRLQDGKIVDDSMPPTVAEINSVGTLQSISPVQKLQKTGKASMSFLTALGLSANNLMTKKGRTILTAFAGSIGIIGIAAILALSNGVNDYIAKTEENAMSSYPLTINENAADFTKLLTTMARANSEDKQQNVQDNHIGITSDVSSMFDTVKKNDLPGFKKYIESSDSNIKNNSNAIQYKYGIAPKFYLSAPDASTLPLGKVLESNSEGSSMMGLSASFGSSSTDSFQELIDNQEMLASQYDVVAGDWPKKYDEAVLVLDNDGQLSDYTLYNIGVLDPDIFRDLLSNLSKDQKSTISAAKNITFTYDDALKLTYKVVEQTNLYQFNASTNTWSDMSRDKTYMRKAIDNGITIKVVGVIRPAEGESVGSLSQGIAYTTALTHKLMDDNAQTDIVKQQIDHPEIDVFTGKTFEELKNNANKGFDLSKLFSVDQKMLASAFSFDTSKLSSLSSTLDFSTFDTTTMNFDPSALNLDTNALTQSITPDMLLSLLQGAPQPDFEKLGQALDTLDPLQQQQITDMLRQIANGFLPWWYTQHPGESLTPQTDLSADLAAYLQSAAVQAQLSQVSSLVGDALKTSVQPFAEEYFNKQFIPYLQQQMGDLAQRAAQSMMEQMSSALQSQMTVAMGGLAEALQSNMANSAQTLQSAFTFNPSAFANAIHFNMTQEELMAVFNSLSSANRYSYDSNLTKLGYRALDKPTTIEIFPKDFEAKSKILSEIDSYNEKRNAEGKSDSSITYSDLTGTLMSSVTNIVNMISLVLIAFVSISLVVSSIMIGIITYISVLERRKEIGILRAMGASKRNVANVFNAETFIEGLISGVFAILVVVGLSIPINALVEHLNGVRNIMQLAPASALILILISIVLTVIAGIIPSRSAAAADPVEALRSE
ncbi:ABC transporter ATP-binding protein/permease [Atopobium fossor]|uniref:ABC transporter ATP-binding protein/permease n=1 Tax=Atopobium fossor TaxID=39487 RepID=UPI00041147F7|nr:ABC transporter ATP-binding protein/permease [Atopobium fossor]